MAMVTMQFEAEPHPLTFEPESTALLIIDMQRDFVEPGGFGEMLGNDVSLPRSTIEPCQRVLQAARRAGLTVIHTREGHRPDLTDAPPSKLRRGRYWRSGPDGSGAGAR
jgi:nicotinamidase-related amidase